MPDIVDFAGRTILAIFAHPDDESLACGGTLARLADAGARVVVMCASRGERGSFSGGSVVSGNDLPTIRARELEEAARVLGVAELIVLHHPDGDLRLANVPQFHAESVAAIERTRPDGVITFAEDGLYWHLDHIGVHERTYTAVKSFGAGAPPLYYVTMQHGIMRAIVDAALANGLNVQTNPFDIEADAFGDHAKPPTFVIDVQDWVPRKLAALRCHRTQIGLNHPLLHITDEQARRFLGTEHFRRSPLDAGWDSAIEQLGERVVSS